MAEKQAAVFVVATANDVALIPPELLRRGRFDELFFVDLPAPAERIEILSIHLRKNGRDPAQFPEPERLDFARPDNRHLAFGQGGHFCVGAPLARLEGRLALEAVIRRFSRLRLDIMAVEETLETAREEIEDLRLAIK